MSWPLYAGGAGRSALEPQRLPLRRVDHARYLFRRAVRVTRRHIGMAQLSLVRHRRAAAARPPHHLRAAVAEFHFTFNQYMIQLVHRVLSIGSGWLALLANLDLGGAGAIRAPGWGRLCSCSSSRTAEAAGGRGPLGSAARRWRPSCMRSAPQCCWRARSRSSCRGLNPASERMFDMMVITRRSNLRSVREPSPRWRDQ